MLRAPRQTSPLAAPLRGLAIGLGAAALVIIGYFIGTTTGDTLVSDGKTDVINTGGDQPSWVSDELDFNTFWEVWEHIRTNYVDQPVAEEDLYYGALQGLLSSLGDPYSVYMTPPDAEEFNQELSGSFFGIGAEIGIKDDNIVVIAPLPDTPAERAGVLAGDVIVAIDGVSTADMTVNDAVEHIRGPKDTQVVLTLSRNGEATFEVPITRAEIVVKSVKSEMRDDDIGYIEVSVFNEDTADLFRDAAESLVDSGARGLIVDLRNNPGGLLDVAITMAGYWIDGKTVVIEEIRGTRDEYQSSSASFLDGVTTVVLVNGGSASASEILAGALQDYKVATVVGEQTFGKGSVQEYHELPDGSAVKMTIARWLTPLGRSIDEVGITPDVVVEYTEENYHAGTDPQLDAAVNLFATP